MHTPPNPQSSASNKLVKTLTDSELESLITAPLSILHKTIITILADTGLRLAELCALQTSDLWLLGEPLNALEVRAEIAKNHESRVIPLSIRVTQCVAQLHDYLWSPHSAFAPHYAFFRSKPHLPLTHRNVQRIISNAGYYTLHKKVTPHMLRHTFATRLMRRVNIRVVQALLGHKSLSSTQIYTHPATQDLQDAIDALSNRTLKTSQGIGK